MVFECQLLAYSSLSRLGKCSSIIANLIRGTADGSSSIDTFAQDLPTQPTCTLLRAQPEGDHVSTAKAQFEHDELLPPAVSESPLEITCEEWIYNAAEQLVRCNCDVMFKRRRVSSLQRLAA